MRGRGRTGTGRNAPAGAKERCRASIAHAPGGRNAIADFERVGSGEAVFNAAVSREGVGSVAVSSATHDCVVQKACEIGASFAATGGCSRSQAAMQNSTEE